MMETYDKWAEMRVQRLDELIYSLKIKKNEFAFALGFDRPEGVYRILNGFYHLSLNVVDRIHDTYPEVNIMWLLYGDGDMFGSHKDNKLVDEIKILQKQNNILNELIKHYERLLDKN